MKTRVFKAQASLDGMETVQKANPYHDASGRFTSAENEGIATEASKAAFNATEKAISRSEGAHPTSIMHERRATGANDDAAAAVSHGSRETVSGHHERAAIYHEKASKDPSRHPDVRAAHREAADAHYTAAHTWANID